MCRIVCGLYCFVLDQISTFDTSVGLACMCRMCWISLRVGHLHLSVTFPLIRMVHPIECEGDRMAQAAECSGILCTRILNTAAAGDEGFALYTAWLQEHLLPVRPLPPMRIATMLPLTAPYVQDVRFHLISVFGPMAEIWMWKEGRKEGWVQWMTERCC